MIEKAVGVIGLLTFIIFVGYIAIRIGEPDLGIVVLIVVAMAVYDFYIDIFKGSNGNENGSSG
jgi:hypothetical protein